MREIVLNTEDWKFPECVTLKQAAEAFQIQTIYSYEDCLDMLKCAILKGQITPFVLESEQKEEGKI